ncbi:universal stress protein [Halomarina halobia]|uniref:Universal stress protein n=1 Tax=Halomarina halobia TaxID=3033386 RepID=A0ABD6AAM6_9EURY|nr:universal stress protein [Halomarina sp. PSR21]
MFEHILVPTDGSEAAERAVDEAIALAEAAGATVHALYVVDVRNYSTLSEEDWMTVQETVEDAGERAVERVETRGREVGVEVTTTLEPGIPHSVILDYAERNDVDLVVMATHGRTGLSHLLLGSVTEKVVRASPIPVLTVRVGDDE